jgi:hypothetical protein
MQARVEVDLLGREQRKARRQINLVKRPEMGNGVHPRARRLAQAAIEDELDEVEILLHEGSGEVIGDCNRYWQIRN